MIIGLTGNKQTGKDTCANFLVKNYNFIQLSYAEPLKNICRTLFDFNEEQLNGTKKEEIDEYWKITPRHAMQFIGTEFFRNQMEKLIPNIEKNFWIKLMEQRIIKLKDKCNIVISDVRFLNEAELIRKYDGFIIKIIRNTNQYDNHPSEIETNKINFNYIIENNGTYEELYKKLINIMNN